jgi:hypothetical protein
LYENKKYEEVLQEVDKLKSLVPEVVSFIYTIFSLVFVDEKVNVRKEQKPGANVIEIFHL